jgi:hypothetical protein
VKFVPRQDRPAWHEKAIEAATARAGLYSLIGLLAETKESAASQILSATAATASWSR